MDHSEGVSNKKSLRTGMVVLARRSKFAWLFPLACIAALASRFVGNAGDILLYLAATLALAAVLAVVVPAVQTLWRQGGRSRIWGAALLSVTLAVIPLAALVASVWDRGGRANVWVFLTFAQAILLLCGAWLVRLVKEKRVRFAVFASLVVAAAVGALQYSGSRVGAGPDPETSRTSPFRVVAMGDSYISGEGARSFYKGTDSGSNQCHQAPTSYARKIAENHFWSFRFLACSGARTVNIVDNAENAEPQYPKAKAGSPGSVAQIAQLAKVPDPEIVLLSVGGNDAGFASLATDCITGDCLDRKDDYLYTVAAVVEPALEQTFKQVKAVADAGVNPASDSLKVAVFALTYPDPLGDDCATAGMSKNEVAWVRSEFLVALNNAVRTAAAQAQIRTISLDYALMGHGVCDKRAKQAVNVITYGQGKGSVVTYALKKTKALISGTFHPNEYGHSLLARPVETEIARYLAGTSPDPPAPGSTATPPTAQVPEATTSTATTEDFPPGTSCGGKRLSESLVIPVTEDRSVFDLGNLAPNSTVCFRQEDAAWESATVDAGGNVNIQIPATPSSTEILAQQSSRTWRRVFVVQTRPGLALADPTPTKGIKMTQPQRPPPSQLSRLEAPLGAAISLFAISSLLMTGLALLAWAAERLGVRW